MKDRALRGGATSLLPLSAAVGYTVVMIMLVEALPSRTEALALGAWWVLSALGVAWFGRQLALGNSRAFEVARR